MAEVYIEVAVPPEITERRLIDLLELGLTAEGATGPWRIELVLADDTLLRQLHLQFMGLDSPTDIMTFPDHDQAAEPLVCGGQIYISVERAAEQAAEFGQTASEEIQFLVLHGVLHLCGWDDGTDQERDQMLERQTQLLAAYAQASG